MNITYYLLTGLFFSLLLAWRPSKLFQVLLLVYWLIMLLWSLNSVQFFSYHPIFWSNYLHIIFQYKIDGLATLFCLLISGIGMMVFIYAAIYTLSDKKKQAKLLSLLQIFAVSMVGIVITDSMIVLFLCWELTTISSYLLIQFDVSDSDANQKAFNAMFISVLGGLAMLAGFILLQQQTGSWSIQTAIVEFKVDSANSIYIFLLLLFGAITKSAQFPFHFWLPGAMKAPTPVSAYLHSATMVNAGIYLLARFHPAMSSLSIWYPMLSFFGMSTMLIGSVLSVFQSDLKAILAYTTLFALGAMVYLLASNYWLSAEAVVMFFLFHALYKAAAFMWVGIVDKSCASRNIFELRGLGRKWFSASFVAVISLVSMAGLPPFFGFVVKEMIYEAKFAKYPISYGLITLSVVSSMLISAVSFKCLYYWFIGQPRVAKTKALKYGLLPPTILIVLILSLNLVEPHIVKIITDAASSIIWQPAKFEPAYSGISTILSLITVSGGLMLFAIGKLFPNRFVHISSSFNLTVLFEKSIIRILHLGRWFTFITQYQSITKQLMIIFSSLLIWLSVAVYFNWPIFTLAVFNLHNTSMFVSILSVLLVCTGMSLFLSNQFLINLLSFAVLGLIVSAIFVLQGLPDVAMTQLLVEILTVIILIIALRKASFAKVLLTAKLRSLHALVAVSLGMIITLLLFAVTGVSFNSHLSNYFIDNSLSLAHGRNIVNVILVDFRALDTFGEALVIFSTAIAIWLLFDVNLFSKDN